MRKINNILGSIQKIYLELEDKYNKSKKTKLLLWGISIGIIAIMMFVINSLTPYVADDYHYLRNTDVITGEPLNDISDYLRALYNAYFNWGGRITGTAYTYLFTLVPKIFFNILNTLAYMTVITMIYFICKGNTKHKLSLFIGIHLLIWICVPDYGQVMFWVCGSSNYLWSAIPILGMILMFRSDEYAAKNQKVDMISVQDQKMSIITGLKHIAFMVISFCLGVLAGWSLENASAGMLAILTLYLIYYKINHIKLRGYMISAYLGGLIGFIVLIVAPGNYVRAESDSVQLSLLFKVFMISYFWIAYMMILCALYIVSILVAKAYFQDHKKLQIMQSIFFVLGALGAAYCMVAAPTSPERTWFIVVVFGIIAVGMIYSQWELFVSEDNRQYTTINLIRRIVVSIISVTAIYCAVMWADTAIATYEIKSQTNARNDYILSEVEKGNKEVDVPIISHKYPLLANHDALFGLSDIQEDENYWINQSLARYYGLNKLRGYYKQ